MDLVQVLRPVAMDLLQVLRPAAMDLVWVQVLFCANSRLPQFPDWEGGD